LSFHEDVLCPRGMLQNVIWTSLSKGVQPLLSCWPVNKLRERALSNLMEHIHYEDENTNYICVDAVSKVIASVEIEAPLRNYLNKMQ
jgi:cycloartenol synthase